jgi:cytidylate kinase
VRELGYRHDSGAMYRAVGWKAVKDGVALDDEEAVAALARRSHIDV